MFETPERVSMFRKTHYHTSPYPNKLHKAKMNAPLYKRPGDWSRNFAPRLFLGLLLGRRQSAIGQFFLPVPSNSPRGLCESELVPVSLLFNSLSPKSDQNQFYPNDIQSIKVSGKLPTYHSPNPIFCPKWEVSVNVDLGKG